MIDKILLLLYTVASIIFVLYSLFISYEHLLFLSSIYLIMIDCFQSLACWIPIIMFATGWWCQETSSLYYLVIPSFHLPVATLVFLYFFSIHFASQAVTYKDSNASFIWFTISCFSRAVSAFPWPCRFEWMSVFVFTIITSKFPVIPLSIISSTRIRSPNSCFR